MVSETMLTTLIGAGQAITLGLIGLIGVRLGKVKTDVTKVKRDAAEARTNSAAAREQVENEHRNPDGTVINMRHENDARHVETKGWIDALRSTVTGEIRTLRAEVGKDIGGIRQELRDDRRAGNESHQLTAEQLQQLHGRVSKLEHQKETP